MNALDPARPRPNGHGAACRKRHAFWALRRHIDSFRPGRSPASDPFGAKGRSWIAEQQLPIDERLTVDAGLRQLDFVGAELAQIDIAARFSTSAGSSDRCAG